MKPLKVTIETIVMVPDDTVVDDAMGEFTCGGTRYEMDIQFRAYMDEFDLVDVPSKVMFMIHGIYFDSDVKVVDPKVYETQ